MTLRLILIRHAKSSWDQPGLDDHARPLNGRGRRSAIAVGEWLADRGYEPGQVISSDSQRTRETWAFLSGAFETAPKVLWSNALYHAGAQMLLDQLRHASDPVVLMLGHNPGIAQFAAMIVRSPPQHPRFPDYPTAATLVADFGLRSWAEVDWDQGRATDFTVPRDLGVE
ncbi:Phosphoglycerate mutase family protein [Candidatus Rhodobacter oscarellae]|uniref:Phosphoglycerate mutase family protein n=1 Tax=Candidatus Rhodobacter oscarellae TaxID=1675527 RepID=A0A0J9GXK4_9RHOB|nr:histidine phosphatase family protein [Candidatus Rhodobacter lobularis]KMW58213.1 Phosphoglycerate mutase family protein [Candidatus Rhodobacter lobularis]